MNNSHLTKPNCKFRPPERVHPGAHPWRILAVTGVLTAISFAASAVNIAPLGTGIMGVNDAIDEDAGTPRFNAGVAANINDGDTLTRVDNWFGNDGTDGGQAISFVGIVWPTPRYERITSLDLVLATFTDGGWFGVRNNGPGPGGVLTAADLIEPTVQVSTNGGVSWFTVPSTSTYMLGLDGHSIGGGDNPNPTEVGVTFTLNNPPTRISGIRIIGENGGTADGNGFIGVFELAVEGADAPDSDNDGLPDEWEQDHGLNVGSDDSAGDPDSDGLSNAQEYAASTDPNQADTDGDGLNDGAEVNTANTNPLVADTDGDGLSDGREVNELQTDPNLADTDGDSLSDGDEVTIYNTDPKAADTDNDSYPDGLEVAQGSDPTSATSVPDNWALSGTGIMGTKESLDGGPETETPYVHAGNEEAINDGDFSTRVDTWNSETPGTVSYVGVIWDAPLTEEVVRLELTLATFLDGGWFGVNGIGPGGGNALTTNHLVEPRVEISNDGGGSWTVVPHTSDYITALTGHRIGGGSVPNPSSVTAVFTLDTPVTGITGIRIIGEEGGQASGGFIGVFELRVRPAATDSDNDGMHDDWERIHGLVVGTNDAADDADSDGATNLQEFTAGTDPRNPDTDGDGLNDGPEMTQHNTDPLRSDTDSDGLSDGYEINTSNTNPLQTDTDGDGFADGLEVALGTNPTLASSYPANQAPRGTGILGVKESVEEGEETPVFNAGAASSINDGDLTTRVDTFNGANPSTASFVGIVWPQPLTDAIVRLELTHAIFFDGGWFGPNGMDPGAGGVLSPDYLTEPIVQVTTDGGTTWTTVAHTSNYLDALDGHPLPAVAFGAPTTVTAVFELTEPQANINGIRILGSEGGTASGGFLGVFELATLISTTGTPGDGPTLINPGIANGQFRFEFQTTAGVNHAVQYKNSLTDADWQNLTTIEGDGTVKQVTDALTEGTRFYRVTNP